MNFIKNNSFILSIIAITALLTFFACMTLGNEEENAIIIIHKGDTLWSLADQYKGNIPHEQWISSVMDANGLQNQHISSGTKLVVPVSLVNSTKMAGNIYLAGEEQ